MPEPELYRLDAEDINEVFCGKLQVGQLQDVYQDLSYREMKGKNQFLIGMKGSMENMTVQTGADGRKVVRGKIVNMSNPNTPAQQAARGRLGAVARHAAALRWFLQGHFRPDRRRLHPFQAFLDVALNDAGVRAATTDYDRALHYRYSNGRLSFYTLVGADPLGSDQGDGTYLYSVFYGMMVPQDLHPLHRDDDQLWILHFNPTTLDNFLLDTGHTRVDDGFYSYAATIPPEGDLFLI